MTHPHAWSILMSLVVSAGMPSVVRAEPGTPVKVDLASGRQFTGRLHPKSDSEKLWLQCGTDTAHVLRPIAWQRVVRAEMAGEEVPVAELRETVAQWETETVRKPESVAAPGLLPKPQSTATPNAAMDDRSLRELEILARHAPATPAAVERVTSIVADAWIANWDRDVENDGLVVQVIPLDARGTAVAASGTLEVFLTGPARRRFSDAPHSHGVAFDRWGHWVQAVAANDLPEHDGRYRLPFQAVSPEFDPRLGSHALVTVRLTVPGSGSFQRTVDYVRVQPFSPIRDYRQLYTGHRWLSIEQTGRAKGSSGLP